MQIGQNKEEHQAKQLKQNYNNKIVNIDHTLNLLEKSSIQSIRGCSSSNPWPVFGFRFLEGSVLSSQLHLHQIEFYTKTQTFNIIESFEKRTRKIRTNNQIFIVYDNQLKLNLIFNSNITWNDSQPFVIETIKIIDYIDYLLPLTRIIKTPIISTVIARTDINTQHILESEIVSIGEFRPIYFENKKFWRYYKETTEVYRNHKFKYIHQYDIFKSINYKVQKRFILSVNQFVYIEVIVVKPNYFIDIIPFYSGQYQLFLSQRTAPEYTTIQPHQFDYFNTLERIITKYYPQQH